MYAGGLDQQVQSIANFKSNTVLMICIASLVTFPNPLAPDTCQLGNPTRPPWPIPPPSSLFQCNNIKPSLTCRCHRPSSSFYLIITTIGSSNSKVESRLAASPPSPSSSSSTSPGSLSRTSSLTDMSGDIQLPSHFNLMLPNLISIKVCRWPITHGMWSVTSPLLLHRNTLLIY